MRAMGCNHWQHSLLATSVGSLVSTWALLLTGTTSGAGATQKRVQRSSFANWRAASAWTGHASSAAYTSPRLQVRPSLASAAAVAVLGSCKLAIALSPGSILQNVTAHASRVHLRCMVIGRGLAAAAGAAERGTRPGAL